MTRRLLSRLRALWTWRRRESDLDDEIRFHLSEEARERAATGASALEAQAAAQRDFGNRTLIREATRETWGWASIERLAQDGRGALRMARRDAGFSAVAVLTLALGIGATTAIFNVVHALVLRPLPFPDAERLVVIYATTPEQGVFRDTTSFFDVTAWKNQTGAFIDVAAWRRDPLNITGDGAPESLHGARASHELLRVLGVSSAIGRMFDEREQRGNLPVALLAHGLWMRRYAGDPGILGRTIVLNDVAHTVIGVLPAGLQFPPFIETDVLVPVPERPCRSCGYVRAIARLKPGLTLGAAQRELDTVAARLATAFPDSNKGRGANAVPLRDVAIGAVRTPLLVLLGAGVLVLLIGCGNVGNLVLARGIARQRELAVRSALGAGAGRLVRQLLTESVALALIAALVGTMLAAAGSSLLVASLSERFPLPEIPFNRALLAFAVLLAVLSGVLSGLPPALMVWKADLSGTLKQDARGQSGGLAQHRLRGLLVVGQTALTVMLLLGAGLLIRSFVLLQQVEIGFDPRPILTADLLLAQRYADATRRHTFLREVLDRVRALPGVEQVGLHTDSLIDGGGQQDALLLESVAAAGPPEGRASARKNRVAGDFFRTMNIPITRGRDFDSRDTAGAMPVAIVNETMARRFWPGEEVLGKRLRLFYDKAPYRWRTIVGVVPDTRYRYDEPGRRRLVPQIFFRHEQERDEPQWSSSKAFVSLVVRTAGEPATLAAAVRAAIWAVDKDQPILHVESMDQVLWESVAAPRIYMLLLGIFGAIALVIASAGIYGVSAYAVVQRTREIGIRLAIGATSREILTLILRRGMLLVVVGAGIGVAGTLALTKVISGFLFGITVTDASTLVSVLLLFVAVALAATLIPARRAARIDPAVAFRHE